MALPDPNVLLQRAVDLEQRLTTNPAGARDELRALFKGEQITLELGADGIYPAIGAVLPLVLLGRAKS